MNAYFPILGLNNNFVTPGLLELHLNVSIFFIRDPGCFLPIKVGGLRQINTFVIFRKAHFMIFQKLVK